MCKISVTKAKGVGNVPSAYYGGWSQINSTHPFRFQPVLVGPSSPFRSPPTLKINSVILGPSTSNFLKRFLGCKYSAIIRALINLKTSFYLKATRILHHIIQYSILHRGSERFQLQQCFEPRGLKHRVRFRCQTHTTWNDFWKNKFNPPHVLVFGRASFMLAWLCAGMQDSLGFTC